MTSGKAFIKKHPVLTYFILTFLVSWGGGLIVLGPEAFLGIRKPSQAQFMAAILAGVLGPSASGTFLTGFIDGRAGLKNLRFRLFKWRLSARWYAVAFLTGPLVSVMTLFALSRIDSAFLPAIVASDDKVPLVLMGTLAGCVVGFCEELGWTGFAIPRLRLHHGLVTTGLIVGFLWGAWHFPIFSGQSESPGMPAALYLSVLLFSFLPPFRVLMVWLYDHTGSLLLAVIMHAGLSATSLICQPQNAGLAVVVYDLTFAAILWIAVLMFVRLERRRVAVLPGAVR